MSSVVYLLQRAAGTLGRTKHNHTNRLRFGNNLQTHSQVCRSMSMFLWRHVPVYRKTTATQKKGSSRGWRLNIHQTKPAVPVRVEGVRMNATKLFTLCVITPDGAVHPFDRKHGQEFIDFWNEWREIYRQQRDYEDARGIPREMYCPRCDEKMHWLKREPAKYVYKEVTAKRTIYAKVNLERMRASQSQDNEYSDSDDEIDPDDREGSTSDDEAEGEVVQTVKVPSGPMEDRYCCPNDECGIREARVEFSHNCANVVVLEGLTDKQWKPNRFGGGRASKGRSQRARAKLDEKPFLDKGYPIDKIKSNRYKDMPYMNGVTHDEAIAIVQAKAKTRYEKSLRGDLPKFNKRPLWYNATNDFVYSKVLRQNRKFKNGMCDGCGETEDAHPSVCFSCGFILCRKCRHEHLPLTKDDLFYPWGACPGCSKKARRSLDVLRKQNIQSLEKLIETNKMNPRREFWQNYVSRAQATYMAFRNVKKVKLSLLLDLMLSNDPPQEGAETGVHEASSKVV